MNVIQPTQILEDADFLSAKKFGESVTQRKEQMSGSFQQSMDNKAAATSIKNITIVKTTNSVTRDKNKGKNSIWSTTSSNITNRNANTNIDNEQLKSGYFDCDINEFQNEFGAYKFINLNHLNKLNLHSSSPSLSLFNLNKKTVSPVLTAFLRPFYKLKRWHSLPVLETFYLKTEKNIKNFENKALNDKFHFVEEIESMNVDYKNSSSNNKCNNNVCGAQEPQQQPKQRQRAQFDQLLNRTGFGCTHYKRRALFVTPCCNKFYNCRFCHDENEDHHFDRKTLTELICSECTKRQKVQEQCESCGVRFGKYTCLICNLFDDVDKQQYHCIECGICRIGGAENFFHCEVCNMCLPIQLKIDGHRCIENMSRSHCPVCLGDIHTSRIPCHIPDCGHLLHKMCFDELLASGLYTCPTCQTSLIDMTNLWDYLDVEATRMPMPRKYENQRMNIFCNDCHKTSKTKFHFLGLKCLHCGAYNTTQDIKRRLSLVTDDVHSA